MIRIHKSSSASFTYGGGCTTGYWYRKGTASITIGILSPSDDLTITERSFDELDDDLFGENIRYSEGSPVAHEWNSIWNFQTKGDIYCYDFQSVTTTGDTDNFLTGSKKDLMCVGYPNSDIGFFYEPKNYGIFPDQAVQQNRYLHIYGGYGITFLSTTRWWKEHGWSGYAYVAYPLLPTVYQGSRGPTFSAYKDPPDGHIGQYGGGVRCYAIGLDNSRCRAGYHSVKWLDIYVKVTIFANESPLVWHSRWREQLELELIAQNPPWSKGRCDKNTTLRGLPEPVLHRPNYEAIFSSKTRNPNWSSLASEAYQNLSFSDINGIAYIKDAAEMGAAARAFAKTLKSIPSKRVKAVASAWLSVHYGFKLQILDTKTLYEELLEQSLRNTRKSKCQAGISYRIGRVNYQARYQVFYNQFDQILSQLRQVMIISDFDLTLENIWDMVPYSFIIDWFVSIGDILSAIDGYAKMTQEHKVIAVGRSIKGECVTLPSMLGLDERYLLSNMRCTAYFRRYSSTLTLPSLTPSVTVNPFNHLAEGAALVISRK